MHHPSGGRVELGLGAGHTPAEFAATGTPHRSAGERKGRLGELVRLVRRLLDGETVDAAGEWFELAGAAIRPPAQAHLPILVGGSGRRLLSDVARCADVVGLTGLGRTLPDGHRHAARFQSELLDEQVATVRAAAGRRPVELNVLVQRWS